MLFFSDNVIADITNKLQDVRNPLAAMNALLRELDLETDIDMLDAMPSQMGELTLSHTHQTVSPTRSVSFDHMTDAIWSLSSGFKLHCDM